MVNVNSFKRNYFLGRALWIRGPHNKNRTKVIYELLRRCGVSSGGIVQMNPEQFMEILTFGFSREVLCHYRVFVIRDFERLTLEGWARFVSTLQLYRHLRFDLGIRLVLLVDEQDGRYPDLIHKTKTIVEPLISDVTELIHGYRHRTEDRRTRARELY